MKKSTPALDEVFLGDANDYLKRLSDESIDLVVSSPPYNLGKEYESKKALELYLLEQTVLLRECTRVLRKSGSIFWQVGAFSDKGILIPLDIKFFDILERLGLQPRNRIVWIRQHGLHAQRKFSCRHETMLWFTKSDSYKFSLDPIRVPQKYKNKKSYRGHSKGQYSCNPAGKNPGDIWIFRNVKHNHEEQTVHPCQFPEDMIARVILSVTEPGDTVLDPYMGAGTVAVVARDLNRHFLGAESDPNYHQVCKRRLLGEPDENGYFPNLKTLRNYVARTGERVGKFRFDVQVGGTPTESGKSRIFSEEHHFDQLVNGLSYEEESFSANVRGTNPPPDPHPHNRGVKLGEKIAMTRSLFEPDDS